MALEKEASTLDKVLAIEYASGMKKANISVRYGVSAQKINAAIKRVNALPEKDRKPSDLSVLEERLMARIDRLDELVCGWIGSVSAVTNKSLRILESESRNKDVSGELDDLSSLIRRNVESLNNSVKDFKADWSKQLNNGINRALTHALKQINEDVSRSTGRVEQMINSSALPPDVIAAHLCRVVKSISITDLIKLKLSSEKGETQ